MRSGDQRLGAHTPICTSWGLSPALICCHCFLNSQLLGWAVSPGKRKEGTFCFNHVIPHSQEMKGLLVSSWGSLNQKASSEGVHFHTPGVYRQGTDGADWKENIPLSGWGCLLLVGGLGASQGGEGSHCVARAKNKCG